MISEESLDFRAHLLVTRTLFSTHFCSGQLTTYTAAYSETMLMCMESITNHVHTVLIKILISAGSL